MEIRIFVYDSYNKKYKDFFLFLIKRESGKIHHWWSSEKKNNIHCRPKGLQLFMVVMLMLIENGLFLNSLEISICNKNYLNGLILKKELTV